IERHLELHKNFITWQNEFDTQLTMQGTVSFIRYFTLVSYPQAGACVYPRFLSSDCVEHHFAHLRSFAGSCNAPNAAQVAYMEASADVFRIFSSQKKRKANVNFEVEQAVPPLCMPLQPSKRLSENARERKVLGVLSSNDQ